MFTLYVPRYLIGKNEKCKFSTTSPLPSPLQKGDVGSNANPYWKWTWLGIIWGHAETAKTGCAWDLIGRGIEGSKIFRDHVHGKYLARGR